jgi:chitinase
MLLLGNNLQAQIPDPALVGYWHNWNTANAPYIPLDKVDSRYNVINVAFAVPRSGTDYQMEFAPSRGTPTEFVAQIQNEQNRGRKILISMGGGNDPVRLHSVAERDTFINTMTAIIDAYGFDGIDIDFEGGSLSINGGGISNPADPPTVYLIEAVRQIMKNYFDKDGKKLILTMAPETAFVQGGMSAFSGIWGAYLPVIDALRDSLSLVHVQLYNSGSMFGIDGKIWIQGTADFLVAMTEAVIQGFSTGGGRFNGLPASKVAVGLPASASAAGGGFTDTATVKRAIDYLRGKGPKPGGYTLLQPGGYPDLRGMMTWSINWDAVNGVAPGYEYARNFERIFGNATWYSPPENAPLACRVFPNPASNSITIQNNPFHGRSDHCEIYNSSGQIIESRELTRGTASIDISGYPPGNYLIRFQNGTGSFVKL